VATSVSGFLWLGVELVEIVTSTHCFSSGDLVKLKNMTECMSQVVMVGGLQHQKILESLLENIYHMIRCHFTMVMFWECTNLVIILTVD